MMVIDKIKEDGLRLRVIACCMGAGLLLLLGGLWFVQIVHGQRFSNNLKRQSFRTVRMPAIRGRILDCRGNVLAADRPRYNAILYLEDLQGQFDERYTNLLAAYAREHPEAARKKGKTVLPSGARRRLQLQADCEVVSNITLRVSRSLEEPRELNTAAFLQHYNNYPYVPFQIVPDLAPKQMAIFAEQLSGQPDLELETQPVRVYPNGTVAAHLLGGTARRIPRFPLRCRTSRGEAGWSGSMTGSCAGRRGLNPFLSTIRTTGSGRRSRLPTSRGTTFT
jgi:penicillin-binding protein 2